MYLGFSGKNYDTDVAEVTKTHLTKYHPLDVTELIENTTNKFNNKIEIEKYFSLISCLQHSFTTIQFALPEWSASRCSRRAFLHILQSIVLFTKSSSEPHTQLSLLDMFGLQSL